MFRQRYVIIVPCAGTKTSRQDSLKGGEVMLESGEWFP